jgi:hypothetical protein
LIVRRRERDLLIAPARRLSLHAHTGGAERGRARGWQPGRRATAPDDGDAVEDPA